MPSILPRERSDKKQLLVINPNTSKEMTELIYKSLKERDGRVYNITMYTAREGPASINNEIDCETSSDIVLREIDDLLEDFDAFLVACYSVHPLVARIKAKVHPAVHVTGIFEASIITAVSFLPQRHPPFANIDKTTVTGYESFGIVSTGSNWNPLLTKGVMDFLGHPGRVLGENTCTRFQGVETTGLTAKDLHYADETLVKNRVKDATKRLIRNEGCSVVCLGCAGMVGMGSYVREAIFEEKGVKRSEYRIIDPVRAAIAQLEAMDVATPVDSVW